MSGSDPEKHSTVDVGKLIERGDVDVNISTRESQDDARVRRFKEIVGFILAVSVVLAAMRASVYLMFFQPTATRTKENGRWVRSARCLARSVAIWGA